MPNIFLQNKQIQDSLKEPEIESIDSVQDLNSVIEYIRGRNFMNIRKGDSRLCRKINGEVAHWINQNTSSNAKLWVCSPYPNLKSKDTLMEHVVGSVTNTTENKSFIFDGTAGQTNITNQNVLISEVEGVFDEDDIHNTFGGHGWAELQ